MTRDELTGPAQEVPVPVDIRHRVHRVRTDKNNYYYFRVDKLFLARENLWGKDPHTRSTYCENCDTDLNDGDVMVELTEMNTDDDNATEKVGGRHLQTALRCFMGGIIDSLEDRLANEAAKLKRRHAWN